MILRLLIFAIVSLGICYEGQAQPIYRARDLIDCSAMQQQKVSKEALLQAEIAYQQEKALYYPTLSATAATQADSSAGIQDNSNSLSLNLDQKIYSARLSNETDAVEAQLKSSQYDFYKKNLDQTTNILTDMIEIQKLIDKKKALEVQITSYSDLVQILSAGSRAGLSDSSDSLQAQATLIGLRSDYLQNEFEISQRKKIFVLQYEFEAARLSDFAIADANLAIESEQLPQVKSLKWQIYQNQFQKKKIDSELWPELSAQASYATSQLNNRTVAGSPTTEGRIQLTIDMSGLWKDWQVGKAYNSIQEQKSNQMQMALKQINLENQQRDEELKLVGVQLPLLKEKLNLAQKAKDVLKSKLRLGRVSFLDLQQAELNLFNSSQNYDFLNNRQKQLLMQKEIIYEFSKEALSKSVTLCRLPKAF
jgi:outer membrane protein TolC